MTELLQLVVAGLALGAQYALIVLGFVIVYRTSHLLNFVTGAFLMFGAYLAYTASTLLGLSFYLGLLIAPVGGALMAAGVERTAVRRMDGKPLFATLMATIGLLIVVKEVISGVWGSAPKNLGDPWGVQSVVIGSVLVQQRQIAAIVIGVLATGGIFAILRWTRIGLAIRATSENPHAALAQGINVSSVRTISWAIGGGVAALAGVIAATNPGIGLQPGLANVALLALPAMVLGGLDSPVGAIAGGIVIGVAQTFTQGWASGVLTFMPDFPSALGEGFDQVAPFLLMVAILLVRPTGFFGSKTVRRG